MHDGDMQYGGYPGYDTKADGSLAPSLAPVAQAVNGGNEPEKKEQLLSSLATLQAQLEEQLKAAQNGSAPMPPPMPGVPPTPQMGSFNNQAAAAMTEEETLAAELERQKAELEAQLKAAEMGLSGQMEVESSRNNAQQPVPNTVAPIPTGMPNQIPNQMPNHMPTPGQLPTPNRMPTPNQMPMNQMPEPNQLPMPNQMPVPIQMSNQMQTQMQIPSQPPQATPSQPAPTGKPEDVADLEKVELELKRKLQEAMAQLERDKGEVEGTPQPIQQQSQGAFPAGQYQNQFAPQSAGSFGDNKYNQQHNNQQNVASSSNSWNSSYPPPNIQSQAGVQFPSMPSTQTSAQPPSTQPSSTQPPSTQPPSTQPSMQPLTQASSTQPPSTQPSSTQPMYNTTGSMSQSQANSGYPTISPTSQMTPVQDSQAGSQSSVTDQKAQVQAAATSSVASTVPAASSELVGSAAPQQPPEHPSQDIKSTQPMESEMLGTTESKIAEGTPGNEGDPAPVAQESKDTLSAHLSESSATNTKPNENTCMEIEDANMETEIQSSKDLASSSGSGTNGDKKETPMAAPQQAPEPPEQLPSQGALTSQATSQDTSIPQEPPQEPSEEPPQGAASQPSGQTISPKTPGPAELAVPQKDSSLTNDQPLEPPASGDDAAAIEAQLKALQDQIKSTCEAEGIDQATLS